ncbi:MAG: hypothetical protein DRP03_00960 [Candidatus Aenigmatarchaeota archaeon]|nr:MAG: hypothetical protein DRP03_00960 [Candidatus Aenigmarchaeota archaeon]
MSAILLKIIKELVTKTGRPVYTKEILRAVEKANHIEMENIGRNLALLERKGFLNSVFDESTKDYVWMISFDNYYKNLIKEFEELMSYSLYSVDILTNKEG